ncbi:unnamed protein product [Rhizopus stolonifer]
MSGEKDSLYPFLSRHVSSQVSNTQRLCYRHRPDLVKNRGLDEFSAQLVQQEIECLPTSDQEAISHVWSLFAAAPSEQRILILKGLISTCCMPQLSFIFNTTKPLLRIDFVAVLPKEITLQIFSYLDAKTLCHAAEVSHTWKFIADEDSLWHKMCEQHIDKKCEKCGWGLPLLDKKSKISIKSQSKVAQVSPMQIACGPSLSQKRSLKRKRTTTTIQPSRQLKRPWKEVYSERLTIERNWRTRKYKLLSLQGHTNGVMCVQFCEISKRVITGSLDKTVKVWSLETGQLLRTLIGHTREVRALQFDDAKLVTGAMDNALKIWNYHTGQCIRTLEGHTGGVLSLHFDSRTMASGSTDHTVRVWNFDLGECCTLVGHTQWVNSVRICLEGKMLISSSDDASVRLWDLQSRSCVRVFQGHVGQVQMALPSPHGFRHRLNGSPDSPIIISSALDNTIKMWDITNGKCLRTLFGHIQGIWGLDFDKLRIVSGSHDKTLRVWDAETGDCLYALEGHHGPVTAVKLSDTKIISASDDGEVKIWDFGLIK